MGHSSLAVSLIYLSGLGVSELEEGEMPVMFVKLHTEVLCMKSSGFIARTFRFITDLYFY